MNIFYLQNTQGLAFGRKDDNILQVLKTRATNAVRGQLDQLSVPTRRKSRRADAIPVHPKVRFSQAAQTDRYIIDIQGRDYPGLLWDWHGFSQ